MKIFVLEGFLKPRRNFDGRAGVLLFGPPGCGKTLIARKIGSLLGGREPRVINGPELLSKYVGQSEENVRALFAEARKEYAEKGDQSGLHVIIFDEIDALCKQRGRSASDAGVGDSVVNQLLSYIDGVDSLNNLLLIGMTNRKDLLDEALLRPGRLEVHVEVGIPDLNGRRQIVNIHTAGMRTGGHLGEDVDIAKLAQVTENYSGAEIEGVCRAAASFAFDRNIKVSGGHASLAAGGNSALAAASAVRVTWADFSRALEEVRPALGADSEALERLLGRGLIDFGPRFRATLAAAGAFVRQMRDGGTGGGPGGGGGSGRGAGLFSVLLHGPPGSGKSAIAASVASTAEVPFVRLISPENLMGIGEYERVDHIVRAFDGAHRSSHSILIIDDIERLLEWSPVGPRYDNLVLQSLMVLIRERPPPGRRVLVIGTTSDLGALRQLNVHRTFDALLHVPALNRTEARTVIVDTGSFETDKAAAMAASALEIPAGGVGIKRLLTALDLAHEGQPFASLSRFVRAIRTCCSDPAQAGEEGDADLAAWVEKDSIDGAAGLESLLASV